MKRTLIFIFAVFIAFSVTLNAQPREKILIGNVQKGLGADSIPAVKFSQALKLATTVTEKYELIDQNKIDSLYDVYNSDKLNVLQAADLLNADLIIFGRLDRLHNLLRVDIKLVDPADSSISKGTGYDLLNFVDMKKNERMIDPGILAATQRAFAQAKNAPLLYDDAPGTMKVYPTSTLVVAGLGFVGQKDTTKWDIYNNKEVNSFSVVESIFEAASKYDKYTVYDTDTRDSLYALFNLYGIENYMSPTTYEIDALRKMQVDYFVTGRIEFETDSADIKMVLFRIDSMGQTPVREVNGVLREDKVKTMNKTIRKLTYKLLKLDPAKAKEEEAEE